MISKTVLAAGLLVATAGTAAAQNAGPTGQTIARNCYICHGTEGRSPGPIPGLHGLTQTYLVQSLQQFKTDRRPGTIMNRIAKGYSDAQIEAVSGYIAGLK
jgi:sulfide dehydrogenase cytochrome subunit